VLSEALLSLIRKLESALLPFDHALWWI